MRDVTAGNIVVQGAPAQAGAGRASGSRRRTVRFRRDRGDQGLGARPADAVLVGDSPTDLASARSAGMACVLVRGGYCDRPLDELGADLAIDDLAALAAALSGAWSEAGRQDAPQGTGEGLPRINRAAPILLSGRWGCGKMNGSQRGCRQVVRQ